MLKKLCYVGCLFFVTVMMLLFGESYTNASVRNSNVQVSDVGSDNKIDYGNTARKLAVSSDGTIYALFYGSNGIRVARSSDQGGSFQPSVQVDPANRQPEIAVSSNDVIYVAWTDTSGNVWLSRSTDRGVTFSGPQNIGNSGSASNSSLHMATDGNSLYILPKNGKILSRSSDSGQQFSTYTFSTTFSFSDIHVDSRTGDVYIQKDNPTVYYFKSTDYGASFGAQQNGGGSIYYSVGTLSSGPNGTYLFVTGKGTTALKINLGDNTSSTLNFPNSSYNYGRSVLADEYGNIVTGYSDGTKVYFSISNDLGNTFDGNYEVATTNMSNIGINPTNGDIMFLYASNGQIYLSTYKDELIGYTPNLSKSALYFDSSSMQQSVTITNTSSSPITIQDISISGEFSLTTTYEGTLDGNESCQVTIAFSPASAGSKTGALSITTSAFNHPRTVRLSGTAADAYTVTYNGNGHTGGSVPTDDTTYAEGTAVTAAGVGDLVKTGHTFSGWNTEADGSGTAYAAGATFYMGAGNITLYAQWTADPSYTVTFEDYNGTTLKTETVDHGSGATAPADPART
ncbi:MAG: InlB B-repeat-containing protein, partial [Thermincola sp.]|nr:InlB B-repeat-containing protein [Thermincola sp.]